MSEIIYASARNLCVYNKNSSAGIFCNRFSFPVFCLLNAIQGSTADNTQIKPSFIPRFFATLPAMSSFDILQTI